MIGFYIEIFFCEFEFLFYYINWKDVIVLNRWLDLIEFSGCDCGCIGWILLVVWIFM